MGSAGVWQFVQPTDVLARYHHQAGELRSADHDDVLIDVHGHVRGAVLRVVGRQPLRDRTRAAFGFLGHGLAGRWRRLMVLTQVPPPNGLFRQCAPVVTGAAADTDDTATSSNVLASRSGETRRRIRSEMSPSEEGRNGKRPMTSLQREGNHARARSHEPTQHSPSPIPVELVSRGTGEWNE